MYTNWVQKGFKDLKILKIRTRNHAFLEKLMCPSSAIAWKQSFKPVDLPDFQGLFAAELAEWVKKMEHQGGPMFDCIASGVPCKSTYVNDYVSILILAYNLFFFCSTMSLSEHARMSLQLFDVMSVDSAFEIVRQMENTSLQNLKKTEVVKNVQKRIKIVDWLSSVNIYMSILILA